MRCGYGASQELDEVACVENSGGIKRLPGSLHAHRTFNQIERASNSVLLESSSNQRPSFLQVDFAVPGKEEREGGLLKKGAASIILGRESVDLPFVNVIRVPWFRFFYFM